MRSIVIGAALAIAAASALAEGMRYHSPAPGLPPTSLTTGKTPAYNNVTTAGIGVVPVYGVVSVTAQVAAISATTLLATGTAPGAGMYELSAYSTSTVTCATPGPAVVGITVTYTDETGTKTAQTLPLAVNGGATLATTMGLGVNTNSAAGRLSFWAAASSNIQYATTYTACTSGTGTYTLRLALKQLQ